MGAGRSAIGIRNLFRVRGACVLLAFAALVGSTAVAPIHVETAAAAPESAYGPDGTHWPLDTPRAEAARVVNVAASWPAISAAITAQAGTADPLVICVAPGTIAGGAGATSSSAGVLQNVGDAARASRILVAACAGVGTVRVGAGPGVAFVGVGGVSIVGIDFSEQSVMIRNSQSFAIGYSKVPRILVTANGGAGVRDVEIVEIVAGPLAGEGVAQDRAEVKSADGFSIDGLRFAGFYAAPHYKPSGSTVHCDTLQFVTTSGSGVIANVTIEDSVLFQSGDQGVMAGGVQGGAIIHSAFFGGATGQLRYPMYPGGDPIRLANLLHGTWTNVSVSDAIVAGSISPTYTFTRVEGSSSTAGTSGFAALGELALDDVDRLAPMPTDARLASIWGSALVVEEGVASPPALAEPEPGPAPSSKPAPVYRFWSPVYNSHFYTISVAERDHIVRNYSGVWIYEGERYRAFTTQVPGSVPLYRFWSHTYGGHFYTVSPSEKHYVVNTYPDAVWKYERIAFYVYPVSDQTPGSVAVSRFWSDAFMHHFYTANAVEADTVRTVYPDHIWKYERDAFRVLPAT